MEATTYTPRKRTKIGLIPPVSRADQLTRTNGLVTVVEDPEMLIGVLLARGYEPQRRVRYELARLKYGSILICIFFGGTTIALAPDNSSMLDLLSIVWPFAQQEVGHGTQ
jgi:hypothetical protein